MNSKTAKIKKIAALPLGERRKLLERAAERAVREYEINEEITVFTVLDDAAHYSPCMNPQG